MALFSSKLSGTGTLASEPTNFRSDRKLRQYLSKRIRRVRHQMPVNHSPVLREPLNHQLTLTPS